ncbi:MAG: hypothetical protein AB7F99_03300 [Vicinamibacterales bacterium]
MFDKAVWALVTVGGVLVALQLVLAFFVAINSEWNDVRLAPTIALLYGVPLWQPFRDGPTLDAIYGPVAPLIWMPAGLAPTPTGMLAVGALESFVLLAVPAAVLVIAEARRHLALLAATLVMAAALLLSSPSLPLIGIHADVPAIAFATAAIACAWTERRRQSAAWRWTGALCVIASVGAKQVMAPLLVVYPLWIGVTSGWPAARRMLASIAVTGVIALGLVIVAFDEVSMFDATILGPSRHGFEGGSLFAALPTAVLDLGRRAAPFVVLLGLVAFVVWRPSGSFHAAASKHRWLFPLAVAVACVPTSLLGDAKLGGAGNASAFTLWFLWLALVTAVATAGRRGPLGRQCATLGAAVVACLLAIRLAPELSQLGPLMRQPPLPSVAYEAAAQKPGTTYFPYNVVVTLVTDGRAYHLDPGLQFREIEGRDVDEEYVRAFVPAVMNRVAASRQVMPHALKYLPRYRRQVDDAALPGWTVMTESDLLAEGERPAAASSVRELRAALPTLVAATSASGATIESAHVSVPDRSRRPRVRLETTLRQTTPHDRIEIEVLLFDEDDRYLQSLVAEAPAGTETFDAEWPVFGDLLRPAVVAVVLVRAGEPSEGPRWRLTGDQVRALVRDSLSAG